MIENLQVASVDLVEIDRFIEEDVGSGDLTAQIISTSARAEASVITREDMVLCGGPWFETVFLRLDPSITVYWRAEEGSEVKAGSLLCTVKGSARGLLTGERTALNLLQTLSGTATLSRAYARAAEGTGLIVLDTRKTLPGLRRAQKYAVRCGGCSNHRFGLYDGILIKENHILAAGSIAAAMRKARNLDANVPIEIEVETLDGLDQAFHAGATRILLDNFSLEMMREAVIRNARRAELEVSGNVSLDEIRAIAETGVNYASVGALTKSVRAVDLSMRIVIAG